MVSMDLLKGGGGRGGGGGGSRCTVRVFLWNIHRYVGPGENGGKCMGR